MKSVGSNEPQMTLFSELLFLESCQPHKCEVSDGKKASMGKLGKLLVLSNVSAFTQEASAFLSWTKWLILFSPWFLPHPGRFSAVHTCRALG